MRISGQHETWSISTIGELGSESPISIGRISFPCPESHPNIGRDPSAALGSHGEETVSASHVGSHLRRVVPQQSFAKAKAKP